MVMGAATWQLRAINQVAWLGTSGSARLLDSCQFTPAYGP